MPRISFDFQAMSAASVGTVIRGCCTFLCVFCMKHDRNPPKIEAPLPIISDQFRQKEHLIRQQDVENGNTDAVRGRNTEERWRTWEKIESWIWALWWLRNLRVEWMTKEKAQSRRPIDNNSDLRWQDKSHGAWVVAPGTTEKPPFHDCLDLPIWTWLKTCDTLLEGWLFK